jgi:hypothetical protein
MEITTFISQKYTKALISYLGDNFKMDKSYNLGQLIIRLETLSGTYEKKFNKKNLKTIFLVAAHVEKKCTFLSISPQPQIKKL